MGDSFEKTEKAYDTLTDPGGALNDALFDTVFGEWLTFFNDIFLGKEEGSDNDQCRAAILSRNSIETSQDAIIDIFNDHKQTIGQNINTSQNISVNCGDEPIPDYLLEKEYDYNIFGMKKGNGCIKYGCCYDIEQLSVSSVEAVNSDITEQHNEMFNKISSSITENANIELGGQCNIAVLEQAIQRSRSQAVQNIQSILTEASSIDVNGSQEVSIRSHYPLRCLNECDEPPTAGIIKQSINIDIHSQNIVQSTYDTIIKNYKELNTSTTLDVKSVPKTRFYLFSIISLIFILIIYYIMWFVAFAIIKSVTKGKLKGIVEKLGNMMAAMVFTCIFFAIWSGVASAWRTVT
jgi:hypothetical protein